MQRIISLFFLPAAFLIIIVCQFKDLSASVNDYDPVTGRPICLNCHSNDKKPSIDYSRDDSCFECHGPGFSERYITIDSKYNKEITAGIVPVSSEKTDDRGSVHNKKKDTIITTRRYGFCTSRGIYHGIR